MKEKLEFVNQIIEMILKDEIEIDTFEIFEQDVTFLFPVLTEDISYSYLQIMYHHIKELAE